MNANNWGLQNTNYTPEPPDTADTLIGRLRRRRDEVRAQLRSIDKLKDEEKMLNAMIEAAGASIEVKS